MDANALISLKETSFCEFAFFLVAALSFSTSLRSRFVHGALTLAWLTVYVASRADGIVSRNVSYSEFLRIRSLREMYPPAKWPIMKGDFHLLKYISKSWVKSYLTISWVYLIFLSIRLPKFGQGLHEYMEHYLVHHLLISRVYDRQKSPPLDPSGGIGFLFEREECTQ
ncbi:hypothetical protein CDAR_606151 [Caerostris darwini]|uniref:Uncharacterized protein n=1 Tax=Caerostris darwini TaxID=1538125 RepID=A0AAV4NPF8_9ARAC|nr:hypothetical protein CDAR_606151 [Caerostris darwini]